MVILVYLLDIDECRGSAEVCDVNANCQNTRGSYSCFCKVGFTGDGKSCSGKGIYIVMICYTPVKWLLSSYLFRMFLSPSPDVVKVACLLPVFCLFVFIE